MELIVTAYPSEWARRYTSLHGHLRRAVLLAHEGEEDAALDAFDQVPTADRDDLFHFERGAVLARKGDADKARQDLERAIAINPSHFLARETLIDIDFGLGDLDSAEVRLRTLLERGEASGFCYGRLAAVEASRGKLDEALALSKQALACGSDPQVVMLTASLLECCGNTAEAEEVLGRLPTGGCGGHNVPLAEFWVRHGKNLEKALSAFQGAMRHEPDNPRWRVRIAQVYFAQGRRAEAEHLATMALETSTLDPEMSNEAKSLMEACRSVTNP
jgi:tetratricopeptide (TPR) repeat protein